jgi:hypothetical protein
MAGIDYGAIKQQLNMPDLTDEAVEDLLGSKGITTEKEAQAWAQRNAAPAQPGFFAKGWQGLVNTKGTQNLIHLWDALGGPHHVPPKGADTKAAPQTAAEKDAAQKKQEAADEKYIKEVAQSPWTTAANALSQEFTQDMGALAPVISGQAGQQATSGAAGQAAADLGLSGMSPGAQWLAQGAANSAAQSAGVTGAMNAEAQTYAKASGPISNAIAQWGADNALGEITAPEASWLSALASHVTSNLSYYGQIPKADLPSLSPSVASALQLSGGYGGTTSAGLVPIQNVVPSATGGTQEKTVGTGTTPGVQGTVPGSTGVGPSS